MNYRTILITLAAACSATSPTYAQTGTGPCGEKPQCENGLGIWAQRLHDAWNSSATSNAQRQKMNEIIAANRSDSVTDWQKSAMQYFTWRNNTPFDPRIASLPAPKNSAESLKIRYRQMRLIAEDAVRGSLVDPGSAKIEFPNGFFFGSWKPDLFEKKITGEITCGIVNARNRMGGYSGREAFVVVIDKDSVVYIAIDNGSSDIVNYLCEQAKSKFPAPQVGMRDIDFHGDSLGKNPDKNPDNSPELRLKKIDKLLSDGIITRDEYDRQRDSIISSL